MKNIFRILKFSLPYTNLIILNTLFNFLSVIFSLFSISMVIPILGILFGTIEPPENTNFDISSNNSIKDFFYKYIYTIQNDEGVVSALGFICLLVGVGTIFKNIFRYTALYCLTPIRNNVIRDIRKKLYSKTLNLPLINIFKFKKGDLVARMTSDITEVEWSIMGVLELFIKEPIHIIIFLSSLIYISPELTLISLVFLPITGFVITKISKSLKQSSLLSQNKIGDIISLIEESITNLKIIKGLNSYTTIISIFNKENESLKKINNHVLWRKDLASPMSEMLSTLVMVLIIWFGGKIVLTSNLDADSFIGFLVIFSQIIPPAKSLTTAFYSIQKGSASAERILNILNQPDRIEAKLKLTSMFSDKIEYKNLSFKYHQEININNINLEIKKGEKIAIVGESGCGKTTLIELLLKFYNPVSGNIFIDGKNINTLDTSSLFAIVTQNTLLFNDTIKNNLLIGCNNNTSFEQIKDATKKAHIDKTISQLDNGYNTIIGAKGNNLSGGERQRLAIARAILIDAPILILDEPTSSLDVESSKYIQNTLQKIKKNKTLITITHKLDTIIDYDKIILMKKGSILEQGTHEFLINKNGVYKKLYEIETLKSNEKN
ncbi:MAG: antibiotic ABC transporter ATP-binding protein [Flavobacteriales bacterium]|nr:antibiotic ABC transporter ATP-binding protein [Flavobacteriales bacterium]